MFAKSLILSRYQGASVPSNHQVFVGLDDIRADAAGISRNAGPVRFVGRLVQIDAKPGASPADRGPDRCGVLADTGGKDDPVEPAERSRQRGDLARRPVAERLDREAGARLR